MQLGLPFSESVVPDKGTSLGGLPVQVTEAALTRVSPTKPPACGAAVAVEDAQWEPSEQPSVRLIEGDAWTGATPARSTVSPSLPPDPTSPRNPERPSRGGLHPGLFGAPELSGPAPRAVFR